VIAHDVGSGFGPKGTVYPEEVLVGFAAWRLGRPVRWTATRSEDLFTTVMAHGKRFDMELAATTDGSLRALRGRLVHDIGAYAASGAGQPEIMVPHMISPYRLPAVEIDVKVVYTNIHRRP
jgi:carbon-monoxide dehydrogenase large subunit